MKVVFMGTPDYAARALEAIINAGHEVTAAVTQPDRPKGRSGQVQCSPVKECAVKHGITVLQPVKIKTPEAIEELRRYMAVSISMLLCCQNTEVQRQLTNVL